MTTKTKPSQNRTILTQRMITESGGQNLAYRKNVMTGSDTITYEDGRRLPSGHWPWKACVHTHTSGWKSTCAGSTQQTIRRKSNGKLTSYEMWAVPLTGRWDTPSLYPLPSSSYDESVYDDILRQIDLNAGESVLLYSGIIQAIPLLKGALLFNSVIKKAARQFKKDISRMPFRTAVRTLISADFIDRFVISPTIDDAIRFADATDYVLRVIQTARERNSHRFALQSAVKAVYQQSETSFNDWGFSYGTFRGVSKYSSFAESKAFALLEAKYDIDSVSPLKVWARRVGLTRPLDSAWDLLPFSFVIDYFTRAGDFISALSDEMSDDAGLRGRITKIHDLWGTHRVCSQYTIECTGATGVGVSRYFEDLGLSFTPSQACYDNSVFRRFRIPNPWQKLMQLQRPISDYLSINTNLSSTQKRTLVELFIQAKL